MHASFSRASAVTESEVLTVSECVRKALGYYAHATNTAAILGRLAALEPTTLTCQHGSAYRGDGGALLRELSGILQREQRSAMTASVRG